LAESVYCFPSSVDQKHFAKSRRPFLKVPKDLENIKTPMVGFYGVLDERIDTHLLAELAKNLPHVSFILIGPVVKISPEDLPRYPNLYYLGGKSYQELPNYLRYFDVAFMPFAINDATRYISPTKTLEFIAAGKPILSTRIADVVSTYSEIIPFFSTAQEFARSLSDILTLTPLQKHTLERKRQQIMDNTSWDKTVRQMEKILNANNRRLIIKIEKATLSLTKKGYSGYAYN
jgi:glycosyltransferase involved in cell wall biosynthesis